MGNTKQTADTSRVGGALSQLERQLRDELRWHVISQLAERGLSDPKPFAAAMGIAESAGISTLRRTDWMVETSLWIIEKLGLPVQITVEHT